MNYLFFDTETSGLPKNYKASPSTDNNWPRLLQLAWILTDRIGSILSSNDYYIFPDYKMDINEDAIKIHGLSKEFLIENGHYLDDVLRLFEVDFKKCIMMISHNMAFDYPVVQSEILRLFPLIDFDINSKVHLCTMLASTDYCAIPGTRVTKYKWPKLNELYYKVFGKNIENAHNALSDVNALKDCFFSIKDVFLTPKMD